MKKQIIIIGGGYSIKEGISKGLWDKIKGKEVIGCNYSFNHFPSPTLQCFADNDFYDKNCNKMKSIPLIVGVNKKLKKILPNTILLPSLGVYHRDIKMGVYKTSLVGFFSLSLAIYLANPGDEIYLLGMDYGEARKSDYEKFMKNSTVLQKVIIRDEKNRPLTHYYQGELSHRGIGRMNYYNSLNRAELDYKCYKVVKDIKIYNVSLISKIPNTIFPKLSYDDFFKKLDNNSYNQTELRKDAVDRLKWAKKR